MRPYPSELTMTAKKKIRKNKTRVVCVAEFRAFHDKIDDIISALQVLMKHTNRESGCIRYELNQITDYFNNQRPNLAESFEVKLYREILP